MSNLPSLIENLKSTFDENLCVNKQSRVKMMKPAINLSLSILESIQKYLHLIRLDSTYEEAIGLVLPVLNHTLFADCFTIASLPKLQFPPTSSLNKAIHGETVLLEEIFQELALEIIRLSGDIEKIKAKQKEESTSTFY